MSGKEKLHTDRGYVPTQIPQKPENQTGYVPPNIPGSARPPTNEGGGGSGGGCGSGNKE